MSLVRRERRHVATDDSANEAALVEDGAATHATIKSRIDLEAWKRMREVIATFVLNLDDAATRRMRLLCGGGGSRRYPAVPLPGRDTIVRLPCWRQLSHGCVEYAEFDRTEKQLPETSVDLFEPDDLIVESVMHVEASTAIKVNAASFHTTHEIFARIHHLGQFRWFSLRREIAVACGGCSGCDWRGRGGVCPHGHTLWLRDPGCRRHARPRATSLAPLRRRGGAPPNAVRDREARIRLVVRASVITDSGHRSFPIHRVPRPVRGEWAVRPALSTPAPFPTMPEERSSERVRRLRPEAPDGVSGAREVSGNAPPDRRRCQSRNRSRWAQAFA